MRAMFPETTQVISVLIRKVMNESLQLCQGRNKSYREETQCTRKNNGLETRGLECQPQPQQSAIQHGDLRLVTK